MPAPRRADRRDLEEEIQRVGRLLERAHRDIAELKEAVAARDSFIATAGHELRNPLSALVLNATSMAFLAKSDPGMPPWLLGRLAALDRQARRFVRRTTTLLDVSRITTGGLRLDRRLVALDGVVREVGSDLADEAARAGCPVELALDDAVVGHWDPTALEQIACNLLSNAIKYGAGLPVTVHVQADPAVASLSVRDHGIGISDEDHARIFERFERAVMGGDRPGFGVGLWIARQLAVAHGGDIAVESRRGEGSVFTATLPRGIYEPHP
ncbi:MAG TPA: HAMP domain-containing sensor histidine kinase [Polyangiaceae bacterium]